MYYLKPLSSVSLYFTSAVLGQMFTLQMSPWVFKNLVNVFHEDVCVFQQDFLGQFLVACQEIPHLIENKITQEFKIFTTNSKADRSKFGITSLERNMSQKLY